MLRFIDIFKRVGFYTTSFLLIGFYANAQTVEIKLANNYFQNAEYEKAINIYEKLLRDDSRLPHIYDNYINSLQSLKNFKSLDKFLTKTSKNNPDNYLYKIDLANSKSIQNDKDGASRIFKKIINDVSGSDLYTNKVADLLIRRGLITIAIDLYKAAIKKQGGYLFYQSLGDLYNQIGDKEAFINSYLIVAKNNPSSIPVIQNKFQNVLVLPPEQLMLRRVLLEKSNEDPNAIVYDELLIWHYIQQRDFKNAFYQAKSLDLRLNKESYRGKYLVKVGNIAMVNKDYENATKIYTYITDNFKKSVYYLIAERKKIEAKEELVKQQFPVDQLVINGLIYDYNIINTKISNYNDQFDIKRKQANLFAFYLKRPDTAIVILEDIINRYKLTNRQIAEYKSDLGDFYLLNKEPWESSLLYSQAEKKMDDTPLGYMAKFKNAKLSFYRGDFELSKSHLDVLKRATTREIANDAMQLSLTISDNLSLDTTDLPLKYYADADLAFFKKDFNRAMFILDSLLKKYPGHTLTDEVYFKQAEIFESMGEFLKAEKKYIEIVNEYKIDILTDDAYYRLGILYEEKLHKRELAKGVYKNLIINFPGSIFTSEARKRYRTLRGDKIN